MSMPKSPHLPSEKDLGDILNYTIVALLGLLAGFMIGYVFGQGSQPKPVHDQIPAVQHR